MLKNYLKLAYRNLLKNKGSSFINIFGLSIAVACSVVVYLFLQTYWTLDDFHRNGENIFLVEHTVERDHEQQTWGTSPMPLGPALAADFPQVKRAVRITRQGGIVQYADKVFEEPVTFTDEGFFEMFTFPLKYGAANALADPRAVILSQDMASKYFGEDNPLGRQINITFDNKYNETFLIQGVAEIFPRNAGFVFHFLIHFDKQLDLGVERLDDWSAMTTATFIQLDRPQERNVLDRQMDRYVARQNAANEDWKINAFVFDNLRHPAADAHKVYSRFAEAPEPAPALMLVAIAALMLALSCFNYLNISLGAVTRRLMEIGVRKAIGSSKAQLVTQFLTENLLLCFLALLLGVALAELILVPVFNSLFVIKITLSLTENFGLWLFMVCLLAFVGLASGAYPAFYISSFRPVTIFSGKQKLAGNSRLARAFLGLQFVLAFVTVIVAVGLLFNARYLAKLDWGYNAEQTLVVRLRNSQQYNLLRNEALQNSHVLNVAGSQDHVGDSFSRSTIEINGNKKEVVHFDVGPNYFETVGLLLKSGRFFDERLITDAASAVVINNAFSQSEGWDSPIGQTLRHNGATYNVIGVAENFLFRPLAGNRPVFFRLANEEQYRYISVRFEAGTGEQTAAFLKDTWQHLFPDQPFESLLQSTMFDGFNLVYGNLSQTFGALASLALLIACMGLFGLASQNLNRRLKEVSIRKVLGASVPHIILLVNRSFILLLATASVIATTGSFVVLKALLQSTNLASQMPLDVMPFAAANAVVFVAAMFAIATLAFKLVVTNPAEVLRNE